MVSLEPPAPGAGGGGAAEDSDVVLVGVAAFASVVFLATFEEVKHFFEAAELQGFGIAGGGESGFDEFFSGGAGRAFNVAKYDAVAFLWDEMPVQTLGVVELVVQFFLLFGGECCVEFRGGGGHGNSGRITAVISGRCDRGNREQHQQSKRAGEAAGKRHHGNSVEEGGGVEWARAGLFSLEAS